MPGVSRPNHPVSSGDHALDVLIVGAGLMGACIAWAAGRRGLRTAVMERFRPGHPHGSSHGTSRIFRRVYGDPFYVELTAQASDSWERLEADTGERLRTFTGAVDHGAAREPRALAALLAEAGAPHELLPASAAAARWPHLTFDSEVLFHPDAGVLDADLAVAAALDHAGEHGVDVRVETTVTEIRPGDENAVVRVSGPDGAAEYRAKRVVLAAGSWNQAWLPKLIGSAPPLTVTQQQAAHFRRRDPAEPWPVMIFHDTVDGDVRFLYGVPGGRIAPDTIKLGEHDPGTVTTADSRDGVVDPGSIKRLARYVERCLPSLDPEPILPLSCLYTWTPSEDFVVDAVGSLIVCSPCSGHGAKFAPYIGELVAAMVTGDGTPPQRFTLPAHAGVA